MKHLARLLQHKTLNHNDIVKIVGNENLASKTASNYLKKGYLAKIRYDLYTPVDLESGEPIADKFSVGSSITDTSFISHHSAFEFYGYYNQVYNEVNVSSISKFNSFSFNGDKYSLIKTNSTSFVETIRNVRVSTLERTIVDCIKDSGKYIELEETLSCINMIPYVEIDQILSYLKELNSKTVYKKVGAILSLFSEQLNIPEYFFNICHKESDDTVASFDNKIKSLTYDKNWRMYVPVDYQSLLSKE